MRYKATYMPSEILDTTNNAWVAYSDIVEQLDLGYRHSFHGAAPPPVLLPVTIEDGELPRPLPPGMEDPDQVMQHENEFKIFAMAAGRPTLQPLAVRLRDDRALTPDSPSGPCPSTWPDFSMLCRVRRFGQRYRRPLEKFLVQIT